MSEKRYHTTEQRKQADKAISREKARRERQTKEGKEAANQRNREYYQRNREKRLEYQRQYREKDRQRMRDTTFKQRYGFDTAEKARMLERQEHRCAICGTTLTLQTSVVDHDHCTNQVRGILCNACNSALGLFGDCIPVLENAITYLRVYGELHKVTSE